MTSWEKLPKDLQKAILAMIVLYGGTTASSCCGPMVCDPPPPPSVTPVIYDPPPPPTTAPRPTATPTVTPMICDPPPPPSVTPMICDPAPPPSVTPTAEARRHFRVRSLQVSSDSSLESAGVQGMVIDQQGQPLEGLKVTAQGDDLHSQTVTDDQGMFFLLIHEPSAFLLMINDDESSALSLKLERHDLAVVEWVEIGPESRDRLPLAEIRAVDIVWEDGLTFGAETPWPSARYRWSASGGTLTGSGERVAWQPPAEPGRYLLQVVADWGQAGLAVDALVLVVEEDGSVTLG